VRLESSHQIGLLVQKARSVSELITGSLNRAPHTTSCSAACLLTKRHGARPPFSAAGSEHLGGTRLLVRYLEGSMNDEIEFGMKARVCGGPISVPSI
jgi:hypothetical protein